MPYRTFFIPAHWPQELERELNSFLASNRIIEVDRRWLDQGNTPGWSFCVEYLAPRGTATPASTDPTKTRTDYRERLKPEDFQLYCRLKDWRRAIAATHSVPPYMVFTNEQLAQISERRPTSKSELEAIAGVGDARIEKFGELVMTAVSELVRSSDATNGPTA